MRVIVGALIVVVSLGRAAWAQAPTTPAPAPSTDSQKADQIFEEAQALKQAGKNAEACIKYDEALSYNHNAVGTLLNVALCNEQGGKVATALALFTQARDLAREHNLAEHVKAAEEHIGKIGNLVPHLEITFEEKAKQMKLVIDDKVFSIDDRDIRIDPGARHIVVTAPGRVPYEATAQLRASETTKVTIPKLALPVVVKSARPTVGKVLTFSGVGLIATGIGLGFIANNKYDKAFTDGNCSLMGNKAMCNSPGFTDTENARLLGNVGTAVGIVGVAALGVGAYLWLLSPGETTEREVAVTPMVSPDTAGIAAVGRF